MTGRPRPRLRLLLTFLIGAVTMHAGLGLMALAFRERAPFYLGFSPVLLTFVTLVIGVGFLKIEALGRATISYALLNIGGVAFTAAEVASYQGLREVVEQSHAAGLVARDVSLEAAPALDPKVRLLYLREGAPRLDLEGRNVDSWRGHNRSDYRVFPVVGTAWQPTQPVTVWAGVRAGSAATEPSLETRLATLRLPHRAGIRWVSNVGHWRRAIGQAERKHGLSSHPQAVVLQWTVPEEEVATQARRLAIALALLNGAWMLRLLLVALGARFWPRREGHTA
jgi:hypothetical protein